jgi:hypothetical protein
LSRRSSHVIAPALFTKNTDVERWLKRFEMYLEEDNVTRESQKCTALMSRLDDECVTMVENHVNNCKNNYKLLVQTMKQLFDKKQMLTYDYLNKFMKRNQKQNENVDQFLANLIDLANYAYPNVGQKIRETEIVNRFVDGLTNTHVRYDLHKQFNNLSKIKLKDVRDKAVALENMYSRSQIVVNQTTIKAQPQECQCIKQLGIVCDPAIIRIKCADCNPAPVSVKKKREMLCFKCKQPGHYRAQCKSNDKRSKLVNELQLKINNYCNQINGQCLLDNKLVNFVADTGSPITIVNETVLTTNDLNQLRPVRYNIYTANGETCNVLGEKTCKIQLGDTETFLSVLVVKNLQNDCLLGLNYLSVSPITRESIDKLKEQIRINSNLLNKSQVTINNVNLQTTSSTELKPNLTGRPRLE